MAHETRCWCHDYVQMRIVYFIFRAEKLAEEVVLLIFALQRERYHEEQRCTERMVTESWSIDPHDPGKTVGRLSCAQRAVLIAQAVKVCRLPDAVNYSSSGLTKSC